MIDQLENMPLAEQAREAILEAILSGRFDGGRLPSEDELAKMLNVSRTTVRTALHSLEQGGILTRRRAVGTTVNSHVGPDVLALQRLVGFDWLLEERGHEVRADVSWERGPRPADIAAHFESAAGSDDFLLTSKLYYADGAAAIYVRDAVPWSEIEIEPDRELPPSLFEFSRRHCRDPIDHAVVQLVPMVNDGTTRLDLAAGSAYVRLHERHYSRAGALTAFSVIDVDDEFVRFEVFRRHS